MARWWKRGIEMGFPLPLYQTGVLFFACKSSCPLSSAQNVAPPPPHKKNPGSTTEDRRVEG